MTARSRAHRILRIVGIALPAFVLSARLPVHSQSAELVLCDRVAADPADPDKPANVIGVRDVAPSDVATAIKFCKTASASSRRALYQLGRAYAANRQLSEAMNTWRKAADKGSTSAMVELGVLYGNGTGVPKDEAQARKLFERAADAGNPRGVTNLAALSDIGGASSDPVKTRALLAKTSDTNPEAQYQLGLMMAEGVGGPKMMLARDNCLRKPPRKAIPAHWSGWRIRANRPRRATGFKRRQSLLRASRGTRQRTG